jgi:hypothetical protein
MDGEVAARSRVRGPVRMAHDADAASGILIPTRRQSRLCISLRVSVFSGDDENCFTLANHHRATPGGPLLWRDHGAIPTRDEDQS